MSKSSKQKLNTKSSTEAELVVIVCGIPFGERNFWKLKVIL
jgi:hypothetical protein